MMLSLDTAYRSFGGEVEASSTPTICRLSDSRRHQLSAIALPKLASEVAAIPCELRNRSSSCLRRKPAPRQALAGQNPNLMQAQPTFHNWSSRSPCRQVPVLLWPHRDSH